MLLNLRVAEQVQPASHLSLTLSFTTVTTVLEKEKVYHKSKLFNLTMAQYVGINFGRLCQNRWLKKVFGQPAGEGGGGGAI